MTERGDDPTAPAVDGAGAPASPSQPPLATVTPLRVPFTYNLKGIQREIRRHGARLRYDEALDECQIVALPPWLDPNAAADDEDAATPAPPDGRYPRRLERVDAIGCATWLEGTQQQAVAIGLCAEALTMLAHKNKFNSVIEAFAGLPVWDGVDRFPTLSTLLGLCAATAAERTANGRIVGRWLSKTIRRIRTPNAPHEDPLFLEDVVDVNGTFRAFQALVPQPELFLRAGADFDPRYQTALQRTAGKAIVVVEVGSASVHRLEGLGAFAARDHDGKGVARHYGFVALSATYADHLPHEFVALRAGEPPQLTLDAALRDQLWAQAYAAVADLPLARPSRPTQRDPEDGWNVPVRNYLHREVRAGVSAFSISAILREAIKIPLDRQAPAHAGRIARILRACKFRRGRARDLATGERPVVWFPPPTFVKTAEELAALAAEEAAAPTGADPAPAPDAPPDAAPAAPAVAPGAGPETAPASADFRPGTIHRQRKLT